MCDITLAEMPLHLTAHIFKIPKPNCTVFGTPQCHFIL